MDLVSVYCQTTSTLTSSVQMLSLQFWIRTRTHQQRELASTSRCARCSLPFSLSPYHWSRDMPVCLFYCRLVSRTLLPALVPPAKVLPMCLFIPAFCRMRSISTQNLHFSSMMGAFSLPFVPNLTSNGHACMSDSLSWSHSMLRPLQMSSAERRAAQAGFLTLHRWQTVLVQG